MKKIVLAAATAGFLVALLDGCVWYYVYRHGLTHTSGAQFLKKIVPYVYPMVFMTMEIDKVDTNALFLFLSSAIANALVYGFVAFCVYVTWSTVFKTNRVKDGPSSSGMD